MRLEQKPRLRIKSLWLGAGVAVFTAFAITLIVFNTTVLPKASTASTLVENRWLGAKNNDFNNETNWSLGHVPTVGEKAYFDSAGVKVISIGRRDKLKLGELELCAGVKLEVKGNLNVKGSILLSSKGSHLNVDGKVEVQGDVFVLNNGLISIEKNGYLQVANGITVENASISQNGGVLSAGSLELRRKNANYNLQNGEALILRDLSLYGSSGVSNNLIVNGGEIKVKGLLRYLKQSESQYVNPKLTINQGKFQVKALGRSPNGFYPGDDYLILLNGGELELLDDMVFDTLNTGDLIAKYGDKATMWKLEQEYSRNEMNDIVRVVYNDYEWWLSQSKWKSKGVEPGTSDNWEKVGEVGDADESCDCADVLAWEPQQKYVREGANNEIFVKYKNTIYRMNKSSSITKGNEPDKNKWAWLKWHECVGKVDFYQDRLISNGGKLTLHGSVLTRDKLSLAHTVVKVSSDAFFYSNNEIEVLDLEIESGANINLKKDLIVLNEIVNHATNSITGNAGLQIAGLSDQTIRGSEALHLQNLLINKDSGSITSFIDIHILRNVNWVSETSINMFTAVSNKKNNSEKPSFYFEENAKYSGGGWVNGPVVATISDEFTFPVGNASFSGNLELSKPDVTSTYYVEYINGTPPYFNALGNGINNVSKLEYWNLKTVKGDETVVPTAYWQNANWSCINSADDLLLTGLNNNKWVSLGHRFYKENDLKGSVTAQNGINDIGLLTFGSKSAINNLNNDNAPFTVNQTSDGIMINETFNNDPIIDVTLVKVEESNRSERISLIKRNDAWTTADENVALSKGILEITTKGNKVYRSELKGTIESKLAFNVYPNPFTDLISISLNENVTSGIEIEIINVEGRTVHTKTGAADFSGEIQINGLGNLKPGSYLLKVSSNGSSKTKRILKQ